MAGDRQKVAHHFCGAPGGGTPLARLGIELIERQVDRGRRLAALEAAASDRDSRDA